jgi:predicted chitinase
MIRLTETMLNRVFPRAPRRVLDGLLRDQKVLADAGILHTRQRLKFFLANVGHECDGFAIPKLTENIRYDAERMADVWSNRFPSGIPGRGDPEKVRAKYGTGPGWQLKAFDDIYGNRMGNRPGTRDGSMFIGRGGPQWTGREGYAELERQLGRPFTLQPELAADLDKQAEICAAFWKWKRLNRFADVGDFNGCVKAWNGGLNGIRDRQQRLRACSPFVDDLPGDPPTKSPPKEVVAEATRTERTKTAAGGVIAGTGTVAQATQPEKPFIPWGVTYTVIGCGAALFLYGLYRIAKKVALVKANWR